MSAGELLRKAVESELKAQSADHSHWMYQEKTEDSGKEQVKWIVEMQEGDLDRLWSVNGRPITGERQRQEDQRIEGLLHKSGEQKKRHRAQEEDGRQTERLFKILPDAVTARFGERKDTLVEILFQPNPNFRPSSHEAAVFHPWKVGSGLTSERTARPDPGMRDVSAASELLKLYDAQMIRSYPVSSRVNQCG